MLEVTIKSIFYFTLKILKEIKQKGKSENEKQKGRIYKVKKKKKLLNYSSKTINAKCKCSYYYQ